jgi:hypothetical protein
VIGLAPSAAAAEVLAEAVGVPTENTTKWLTEAARQPARLQELKRLAARLDRASPSLRTRALTRRARTVAEEIDRWRRKRGQLMIVDEASMAGTFELDTLTAHARAAGAKVLLVGDWAQLSPVAAGGAFKLVASDRDDPPHLTDVRRFRHEWERDASLGLRAGRMTAAQTYVRQGRVEGGDRESMLDLLYEAWRADTKAGKRSIMVASDAQTVADLNARARADRVVAGEVTDGGLAIGGGATIGVGDVVVTRLNQRDLATSGAWVKNGDTWAVTDIRGDGSVRVRRPAGGGVAVLPAGYVREHVELGYATTAHRAQGRTLDTAHAYVTATTLREPLYVMATRGRESNRLYVDTMYDPDLATAHDEPAEVQPVDVLKHVLAHTGADTSATETRHQEAQTAESPARLEAEGAAIHTHQREKQLAQDLIRFGITPEEIEAAKRADQWRPLLARIHHAERLGIDLDYLAKFAGEDPKSPDRLDRLLVLESHLIQRMATESPHRAQGPRARPISAGPL